MSTVSGAIVGLQEWFEKDNCTYFAEKGDMNALPVLGFTLKIVQGVCSGRLGEGGWLCELYHANHGTRKL